MPYGDSESLVNLEQERPTDRPGSSLPTGVSSHSPAQPGQDVSAPLEISSRAGCDRQATSAESILVQDVFNMFEVKEISRETPI